MTVVGVDDTDSRDTGMCTTFVAHRIAAVLSDRGFDVERVVLARLNPAVPHKTRGNASLSVHVDAPEGVARKVARDVVERRAQVDAAGTNPGVVVAPGDPLEVPTAVTEFANAAVREFHDPERARELATGAGFAV
jgi:tRNA(Ile2)-agmatinylcytidine synthase